MKTTLFAAALVSSLMAACGGGSASPSQGTTPPPATYTVGGTVTGLTGTLVLRVNDAADISVNANGAVTLASSLANGANYSVAVKTQPSGPTQLCELANGTGTVASANVTNVTVTCAAVPLTLVSSTPSNGATGATRDAPLTLTFSTTIDAAAATVVLTGPAGDVANTTQVSGTRFIVTPTVKLAKLGAYTLTVGGVKGTGGELLAAPVALGFEAADGSWSTPTVLATQAGDASYASVAMDAKGNALAMWVQSNGTTKGIAANHWSSGAGWDGAVRIDNYDFGAAAMPEVRFDHDGNALALWVQGTAMKNATWFNRFDAAGAWSGAHQLSTGKVDTAWPTFDFDAHGNALGMWENVGWTYPDIYDYTPSIGWTGAAFTSIQPIRSPRVCIDSTGRAQMVYSLNTGSSMQVVSKSHVKGAWASPVVVDEIVGSILDSLRIVCPATGGAVAAWIGRESGVLHAHVASQTSGGGWTAAERVDTSTGGVRGLSLSSDAAGNTLIVWSQDGSTTGQLWARRAGTEHAWSSALRVDDATAGNSAEPDLALDAAGNGWAVWRLFTAGKPSRISAARVRHGEFSAPLLIDPDTDVDATVPRVAVDPEGNAIAVWLRCLSNCYAVASRFE